MRTRLTFAALATIGVHTAAAQAPTAPFDVPAWAFPVAPPASAPSAEELAAVHRVPDSRQTYTGAQVRDRFAVPDWFPTSHPHMPAVVAVGRKPGVNACAYCHLPDGHGRPENAVLAGLPAAYVEAQVADLKAGTRALPVAAGMAPPFEAMRAIAQQATPDEIAEAARYFAALRFTRPRTRVVETDSLPRLRQFNGVYAVDGPNAEPIGRRLIDATTDATRHEDHDPRVAYVTFVPRGSLARGRALATGSGTPTAKSCVTCHGPALHGLTTAPPIAGRAPSYLLRQLLAFRAGTRSSPAGAPMRDVASGLSLDDMIAVAAYAGSVKP